MREEAKDPWRIRHILEAIDRVSRYVENLTFEDFVNDDRTFYAVVKNIEIIGEAANMLTYKFRESYPLIPWRSICGMRNYIVHEYFAVDSDVVWNVVKEDLPSLKQMLLEILDSKYPE